MVLIATFESSEHVARYWLLGSIAIEFILLLWGLVTYEIGYNVFVYIANKLELLSPPTQNNTDPE
jgi:hypothetical protein